MDSVFAPQVCGCPIVPEGPSIVNTPGCSGTYLFMMYVQSYLLGRCDISTPCHRIVSAREPIDFVDFIVVGAGSAGSIVAGRLSEDGKNSVVLLESGGPASVGTLVPSFYTMYWGHEELDWRYRTVPGDYCLDQGDKGCNWPRGKGLGGSSLLNGMMYHRGHKADYADWVARGAEGWSWEEMLPYLDMTEGNKQIGGLVSGKYHSASGPLPVQTFNYQPPEAYVMLKAVEEAGFPVIDDMNDPATPDGFTVAQTFNYNGQRYTTARAYLQPESVRPNLKVLLHSHVSKVIFDGKRAVGVEYIDSKGNKKTIRARKEVILSAGALNSPQILMLSGVGPRRHLRKMGIPVIANLPVGQNLKNHVGATLYFTLTKRNKTKTLDWSALTEYMLTRGGPMSADGITQVTGLLSTSMASEGQPDMQVFFNGFYAECSETGVIGEPIGCGGPGYNITANAALLLPYSDGHIALRSTNPLDSPLFFPNFFEHPDDMARVKEGLLFLKRIYESRILQEEYGIILDPEYTKECDCSGEVWSDSWLECIIRLHTDPQNHQSSTTAIGMVLDPHLTIYGLDGIRVCDAGSMPSQPTGNPQGAIMAVAEKCAALIKEKWA